MQQVDLWNAPIDSGLARLEQLARERLGSHVSQVYYNRWTVSVVFVGVVDVEKVRDLFPECHVHPISRVQVGARVEGG